MANSANHWHDAKPIPVFKFVFAAYFCTSRPIKRSPKYVDPIPVYAPKGKLGGDVVNFLDASNHDKKLTDSGDVEGGLRA